MNRLDSGFILSTWRDQIKNSNHSNTELDTSLVLPIVLGCTNGKPYIMVLSEEKPRAIASMRAITITLNDRRPSVIGENWALVFTLEDWALRHVFAELCLTFATRIREVDNQTAALDQVYDSMNQWKRLLQPLPEEQTDQILLGVAAELTAAIIISHKTNTLIDTVIDCGTGPSGAPQDFIFPSQEYAWEVKAIHQKCKTIMISSPEQLDASTYPIRLVTVELERNTESTDDGITVNELMQKICDQAEDPNAVQDKLEDGIFKAGLRLYSEATQKARFIPHNISVYDVHDDFPRIEASVLPDGIVSLTYSIQRDAIEPYRIYEEEEPLNTWEQ